MSYQRPTKDGHYYVWMGSDGLHVSHDPVRLNEAVFESGKVGKANAKAVIRGLVDFLAGEGLAVNISDKGVTFHKVPVPEYIEEAED